MFIVNVPNTTHFTDKPPCMSKKDSSSLAFHYVNDEAKVTCSDCIDFIWKRLRIEGQGGDDSPSGAGEEK